MDKLGNFRGESSQKSLVLNLTPKPSASTRWRKLDEASEELVWRDEASGLVHIEAEALRRLSKEAFRDVNFLCRTSRLEELSAILHSDEASDGDKFVARLALKNASVAAAREFPLCQDTGVASAFGWKGGQCLTDPDVDDGEAIAQGAWETYSTENLRHSIQLPVSVLDEVNSGNNLPALVDIRSVRGASYDFLFVAKGGGSSNKARLFQQSPALLRLDRLVPFLVEKIRELGTSACPPYKVAIVIGGLSPEQSLETAKLLSCGAFEDVPKVDGRTDQPKNDAPSVFRDLSLEATLLEQTRAFGIGAQLIGNFFALSVRVLRLPRHSASLPISLAVSCLADRQIWGRIDHTGVWLEQLAPHPERFLDDGEPSRGHLEKKSNSEAPVVSQPLAPVAINLDQPMDDLCKELSKWPVGTLLSLSGTLVVARDLAHAKIRRLLEADEAVPQAFFHHPIFYAGPAKTPVGRPSGSLGPTTAGRMDEDLAFFQARGAARITLAKGNRGACVRESCQIHGGFYLGTLGGVAAWMGQDCLEASQVVAFPELGMEAVRLVKVRDLPAFIVIDDKVNDLYHR